MAGTGRGANDPHRKDRIVAAALEMIIEHGVHGTTHRRIAERAGVPLGSLTYYFDSLPDILRHAFALLSNAMSTQYRERLVAATSRDDACEAVTDLICGPAYVSQREMTALFELYAYATFDPEVARIAREWMFTSRDALATHFAPDTCRALDALIEGWPMHRVFEGRALDRELVRATVGAVVDRLEPSDGPGGSSPQ